MVGGEADHTNILKLLVVPPVHLRHITANADGVKPRLGAERHKPVHVRHLICDYIALTTAWLGSVQLAAGPIRDQDGRNDRG